MHDYKASMIQTRRDLHKMPEMGWGEFKTTAYIIERLESLGWKVFTGTQQVNVDAVMGRDLEFVEEHLKRARADGVSEAILERMEGYTGAIALWDTGCEGHVTALRFDIDCVGVEETMGDCHKPNQEGFRSEHDGEMHSCGHDGHTSVGLHRKFTAEASY